MPVGYMKRNVRPYRIFGTIAKKSSWNAFSRAFKESTKHENDGDLVKVYTPTGVRVFRIG